MPETLNGLLKQDGDITQSQLTPEIVQRIREELDSLPETEREAKLRELLNKTRDEAKDSLTSLSEDVEVDGASEYSMEGIRNINESEVFELFFERPEMMVIYRAWIAEKIKDYPYLSDHQTTIEVTVWKHLVDQLSFRGIMGYAGDKIGGYISGQFNSVKEAFSPNTEEGEEAPEGIDGFTNLLESVEGVSDAFASGEGEGEKVTGFLNNIQIFIDDITINYFSNLQQLDTLLKQEGYISEGGDILKTEVVSVISNPYIISILAKEGKYEGNGTEILLGENESLQIQTMTDEQLESAQNQFVQEVGELTSQTGGKIDGLKTQTQKIAKLLSKLGFDSESLQGFRDFLSGIPGVGTFLAALLGFFVGDSVLSELDKIGMSDTEKKALESFENYISNSENIERLPFTLREENPGSLSPKEVQSMRGFIRKIKGIIPGEGDEKEANIKRFLEDPKFAEKILTGAGIGESDATMQHIFDSVQSLFSGGPKPSQEEFFNKLRDINIIIPEVTEETGEAAEVTEVSAEESGETAEVTEETGEVTEVPEVPAEEAGTPSIEEQLLVQTGLPTTLSLESGEKINISAFDTSDSSILINGEKYTVSLKSLSLPITVFHLDIEDGVGKLGYIKPVVGGETIIDIPTSDIASMITELLNSGIYSLNGTNEVGVTYTLEVKK